MKKVLLVIFFVLLLTVPCMAENAQPELRLFGTDELEQAVPAEARSAAGKIPADSADIKEALSNIWSEVSSQFLEDLRSCSKSAVSVMIIVILCTAAAPLCEGSAADYVTMAGSLGITAASVEGVKSVIGMGSAALGELSEFSHILLPTLCTAAAAGGAAASAPAKYAASALFTDILLSAANGIIVPLIYAYLAVITANAALGGGALKSAARFIRWICVSLMTALTAAFTIYLGVTGAVSGSADVMVTKAAKTAISAALPVVGGIISDAASSVVAGAGILRSAIGAFGMAAVCGICIAPVAALGARYLLFKLTAACASALPSDRLSELIGGIGGACGMMLGLTGCGAIMFFMSIISSARAVSGI